MSGEQTLAHRYFKRAERAEAELARVRPVVDAAEALVEHWGCRDLNIEYYDVREQLEDALAEKVREAE